MADLQNIPLDQLHPHPDNPRLQLREDVVERLAAEITTGGFGTEHAILVRPHGSVFQVISGHHRTEAARRAGLAEAPAWVREMDDDEAFMQLVLGNTQGELTPLEIGMHALVWLGPQKHYVERTGFGKSYISQLRSAAEVARVYSGKLAGLGDKAKHLYEISRGPRETWTVLVDALVKRGWSVSDTKAAVDKVRSFHVPQQYASWLPLADVVAAHLGTREFSPRTVDKLISAADQTLAWIAANLPEISAPDDDVSEPNRHTTQAEFEEWLRRNRSGESWEPRAVSGYLARLIAEKSARDAARAQAEAERIAEQFVVEGWHHGDWHQVLHDHETFPNAELADGSVSLLLTDPPYGQGFRSDYRLDRAKDHKHDRIANDATPAEAEKQLSEMLEAFHPKLADNAHLLVFCSPIGEPGMRDIITAAGYTLRSFLIWDKQATGMGDPTTTFAPAHERILYAVKGSPKLYYRAADILRHPRADSSRHPTEKPVPLLQELIEATTVEGQLVADPFGGVASTAVAAKNSGRRWWSAELEEKYYTAGEERLS